MHGKPDRIESRSQLTQAVSDATVPLDCTASIRPVPLTARHGGERSRGVPEIQEVLSLNQAQTRDRRVDDSRKTVQISEFTEMPASGIWIAFMSTGGTSTNESGLNINPDVIVMASETDIRTSVYCHMAML